MTDATLTAEQKLSAKQIVYRTLCCSPRAVSVRKGRGTSRHWLYIRVGFKPSPTSMEAVELKLLQSQLVGSYMTDHGHNDTNEPCVRWEIPR